MVAVVVVIILIPKFWLANLLKLEKAIILLKVKQIDFLIIKNS